MARENAFTNIKGKNLSILKAILGSGRYAAYFILWLQGLKLLALPFDLLLKGVEKLLKKRKERPEQPMIFIVGPHRSGTTFISQVMANAFPFHPVGNFNSLFPRSPYMPHKWFRKAIQRKRKPKYRNFYGLAPGIFTIGDTHEVWDQWYGGDHSIVPEELDQAQQTSMRQYFGTLESAAGRPLISKSGRNSMIMGELQKVFPNAFFLIISRDLPSIIRSTIEADETFFGHRVAGWGLRASPRFDPAEYDSFLEAVCHQCKQVQEKVDQEKEKLPENRYFEIDYRDFCKQPEQYLQEVRKKLKTHFNLDAAPDISALSGFRPSSGKGKNEALLKEIHAMLEKMEAKTATKGTSTT